MKCPFCSTENREDREACYHCGKDVSMLRLIVNKARHHFNVALEHAERQRYPEALAELEHCLELDRSLVAAHVVMGTVYAKMEKFDEAERCWHAALALDPHIQKASDYLDKSHLARQAMPLLRRLRWMLGAAAAAVVLFTVLIVWHFRPTADARHMEQITAEIEQGDFGGALSAAERLRESARSHGVRHAAQLLQEAIKQRYESVAMEMFMLLLGDQPVEAHLLYQRIAAIHQPPEPYNRQLTLLNQKAAEKAAAMADQWRQQVEQGDMTYEELARRAAPLTQAFVAQPKAVAEINESLAAARKLSAERTIAALPASVASTTETLVWLGRLAEVAKRAPESRAAATSASQRLVAAALGPLEGRMKKAVAAKNSDALRLTIADLERLASFGAPPAAAPLLKQGRSDLRRLESDRFRASLAALTSADVPKLDGVVAAFEKSAAISVVNDNETSASLASTRRRLAAAVVNWCSDRYTRFAKGEMTADEARWILERAEFALQYYAGKTWRYTKDCVMYCAALAASPTGDAQLAVSWVNRLEKTYPESSYLAQARRLRPAKGKETKATPAPKPKSK